MNACWVGRELEGKGEVDQETNLISLPVSKVKATLLDHLGVLSVCACESQGTLLGREARSDTAETR